MENKKISGKVLYKHLMPTSLEVNLDSGKGFKLTAESPEKFAQVSYFAEMISQDSLITLDLQDGQVIAVTNHDVSDQLNLRSEFSFIGAALLTSTYKKVSVEFRKTGVCSTQCGTVLTLFVVKGEKDIYRISYKAKQNEYLQKNFAKCAPGDRLSLMQAPDGQIINIVNQTKAFEFSCQ